MAKRSLVAAAVMVLCAGTAFSQVGTHTTQADIRVERLLKEAGLTFTIDNEGDFQLYTKVSGNRVQALWIISETQAMGALEIRQIWSIGYTSDQPFSAEILNRLLAENAQVKLGAWQVRRMGGKYVAVFSVQVGADIDRFSLLMAMSTVASTADDMERALTGADVY